MISIESERDAEVVVLELASEWRARNNFFKGGFKRETDESWRRYRLGRPTVTSWNSKSTSLWIKTIKERDTSQKPYEQQLDSSSSI